MPLTQEALNTRVKAHLERAKAELTKTVEPASGTDTDLQPKAVVILQDGTEAVARLPWRDAMSKRTWSLAASKAAELLDAQALLLRVVVTQLDIRKVEKEVGPLPSDADRSPKALHAHEERVLEWVRAKTGGSPNFGDLPPEYRSDCIMVAGIGPGLHDTFAAQPFRWCDGKVQWLDEPGVGQTHHGMLQIVPKWWADERTV